MEVAHDQCQVNNLINTEHSSYLISQLWAPLAYLGSQHEEVSHTKQKMHVFY